jgi:hypothetical protein
MLTAEKELYEPLWDEILVRSKTHGFRIRSIWIADVAFQGDSGVLNEIFWVMTPDGMTMPEISYT